MARRLLGGTLVIATHNPGKLAEMAALLAPYGIAARSAGELGLAEPDGDRRQLRGERGAEGARCGAVERVAGLGGRFRSRRARARRRARDLLRALGRRRQGFRAGHGAASSSELRGKSDRSAYFVAVLALAWPDGHVEIFRGEAHGSVVWPPRGALGFGYDPIFLPEGQTQTFGELEPAIRQRVGHRAAAFRLLAAACLGA